MTPREVQREADALRAREEDRWDQQIVLAWQIERVRILSANAAQQHRAMPSLKQVLAKTREKPTRDQQLAIYQQVSEQYRIPLKTVVH